MAKPKTGLQTCVGGLRANSETLESDTQVPNISASSSILVEDLCGDALPHATDVERRIVPLGYPAAEGCVLQAVGIRTTSVRGFKTTPAN